MTDRANCNKALLWAADWLEASAPKNNEELIAFAKSIAITFRSPGATDSVGGIGVERDALIKECAARLEHCSQGFIEVGNQYPEGQDRDTAYSMADTYQMAAEEIRMMIPAYAAARNRNLERIGVWLKAIKRGEDPPIPELEERP